MHIKGGNIDSVIHLEFEPKTFRLLVKNERTYQLIHVEHNGSRE